MEILEAKNCLKVYINELTYEEFSQNTRKKYLRDILKFLDYFEHHTVIDKKDMLNYKNHLVSRYKVTTVNSYLISVNRYLRWLKYPDLTIKTVKIQRKLNSRNVLSTNEYNRLLEACRQYGNERNLLIIRTLASTGIRVGELKFITYEAAKCGVSTVYNKGKYREIFIPSSLSEELASYCLKNSITTGIIFHGIKAGSVLHPSGIWKILKHTAQAAGVSEEKVYPHSLRRFFAKIYMQRIGNIFELADILGHSNIETTRIYALTSALEKRESLNNLGL